jgi:glycosyltransferase involved in cell wall biosynthesis
MRYAGKKQGMNILLLCKKFPYPLKDGESIAVQVLSKALVDLGCQVSLLAMNTHKHYYAGKGIPPELRHFHRIETVCVDNRVTPWGALRQLFRRKSYHISRFESAAFRDKLRQMLQAGEYDIVQLETLYLMPYLEDIRRYSRAQVALRAHNVEHLIWERIADNCRVPGRRWYLRHLARQLKAYEVGKLREVDMLIPISDQDEKLFRRIGYTGRLLTIPIGWESSRAAADYGSYRQPISLSFIGSLDWMPNQEGLRWFVDRVWPQLSKVFPQLELHIAGRNTPDWVHKLHSKRLVVHGEVPDSASFINAHSMMVVPLLSGSGMRAKILEGMALGKVVLTTTIGLEGIDATDRQEVLIADTPEDFVRAVNLCHGMNGQLESMGRTAEAFVRRHYDATEVAKKLVAAYESALVQA